MIYIIIALYLLFSSVLYDFTKFKQGKNLNYVFILIIFILLAALRYRVGGDTLQYHDAYGDLPTFTELELYGFSNLPNQPLWYVLNAFTKSISPDFYFFQFIHALIINIAVFVIIAKYSKYRFTVLFFYAFFYYFYLNFEILRESIAVVIFSFAYPLLFAKKKYILYYILATIAFLFHASAIFLFFVPIFVHFLKSIKIINLMVLGIIVVVFPMLIVQFIINNIPLRVFILNKLEIYSSLEFTILGTLTSLMRLLPALAIIYLFKKLNYKNEMWVALINMYFIFGLLAVVLYGAFRLLNYFSIFYIIILVDVIIFGFKRYSVNNYFHKTISIFILIISVADKFFYYYQDMSAYSYNSKGYFYERYAPYYSIFNEKVDLNRESIYSNQMN